MRSDLSDFVRVGFFSNDLEDGGLSAGTWPRTGSAVRDSSLQMMVEITTSARLKVIGREEKTVWPRRSGRMEVMKSIHGDVLDVA